MVRNAKPLPGAKTPGPRGGVTPGPRILIVDDDPVAAEAIGELLRRDGHATAIAHDGEAALAMLGEPLPLKPADPRADEPTPFGLLVTDLNMPRLNGLDLLRQVRRRHRGIVPIVITGFGRIDAAVEAVRLGAIDFLTKPIVADDLRLAVRKAINQHTLISENGTLRDRLRRHEGVGTLLGNDPGMQRAFAMIEAAAATRRPILITGETGTGKTAAAHAIHRRAAAHAAAAGETMGPLVRFAFGTQRESDQEVSLYGSGEGARKAKPGALAEAADGTLVLDHLERATAPQQARLIRLLEENTYTPVGQAEERINEARLIFTCAADLSACVADGRFHEALYYRLAPSAIALPALRDRRGDLRLLAEHFVARHGTELRKARQLGDAALKVLGRHRFEGNVRELEQAIAHAVMVSTEPIIAPDDLPASIHGIDAARGAAPSPEGGRLAIPALRGERGWTPTPLDEALRPCEKQVLLAALEANDWNRSETARQLDINRVTLYKKIRAFKLDEPA